MQMACWHRVEGRRGRHGTALGAAKHSTQLLGCLGSQFCHLQNGGNYVFLTLSELPAQ